MDSDNSYLDPLTRQLIRPNPQQQAAAEQQAAQQREAIAGDLHCRDLRKIEIERMEAELNQSALGGRPSPAELRKRFFFRSPRDSQAVRNHETVSELSYVMALELTRICPSGRNLALALTALEDVRMRANAAIAVDDPRP